MDQEEARARFGMPVYLHDHQRQECIIGYDPASPEPDGAVLFVKRGSVLGDRIEYGWERGHLDGPLLRYAAAADQIEARVADRIEEAHYMALRDLEALSRSLRPTGLHPLAEKFGLKITAGLPEPTDPFGGHNLYPTRRQVDVWARATNQRLWYNKKCDPSRSGYVTDRGIGYVLQGYRWRLWGRFRLWREGWRVVPEGNRVGLRNEQGGKQ